MSEEELAAQNERGETILFLAMNNKHLRDIEKLVEKMSPESLGLQDVDGNTALMSTLNTHRLFSPKHFSFVIDKMRPEDLGLQNDKGETAIILACRAGREDVAREILKKMCPEHLLLENKFGNTVLDYTGSQFKEDIVVLLEKYGLRKSASSSFKDKLLSLAGHSHDGQNIIVRDPETTSQLDSEVIFTPENLQELIKKAIEIGETEELETGLFAYFQKISSYFAKIGDMSRDSTLGFLQAADEMREINGELESASKALHTLQRKPGRLLPPENPVARMIVETSRKVIPSLDPLDPFKRNLSSVQSKAKSAFDTSTSLTGNAREFSGKANDFIEQASIIANMLDEAHATLEEKEAIETDGFKRERLGDVRAVLENYATIAKSYEPLLNAQKAVVSKTLSNEVAFRNSVSQVDFASAMTGAASGLVFGEVKMRAATALDQDVRENIALRLQQTEQQLRLFQAAFRDRLALLEESQQEMVALNGEVQQLALPALLREVA